MHSTITTSKSAKTNIAVRQLQLKLNAVRANVHGLWPYLDPDGVMGPQTAKAIEGFKKYRNISSHDGNWLSLLDMEYQRVPMLRPAPNNMIQNVSPSNPINTIPSTSYDTLSSSIKSIYQTDKWVNHNEKGLAYIIKKWEETLNQQYESLLRRLNKFPGKKQMRVRNVMRQMEHCKKFLTKASRYGIVSATREYGSKLSKEEAIRFIKEMGKIIKESPLTKGLTTMKMILSRVKSIIDPVIKVLNKIPGLKYYSVIEKIVKATCDMIQGDYAKSFALYMDAMRELLEQIVIDFVVATLVAIGGWVALVFALVVIIFIFVIDYLFFSDNPGDSFAGFKTRNLMMENALKTYEILTGVKTP